MIAEREAEFNDLLLTYSQELTQEKRDEIDAKIWDSFGEKKAVLITDMAGFTVLTERYGPVHYLSMIRRMQMTAEPIIKSFKGFVVKFEADNCFAVFDTPASAVQAAVAMNLAFDAANILTPDTLDIKISSGIDYGDILLLDGEDMYGNAVNHASKLGEDIATSGEILITKNAMEMIDPAFDIEKEETKHTISNVEIDGFKILY